MGTAYGIYPWGSALVMGKFDGETFLGRLLIFFFGGAGEGKRNSRSRNAETFSQDDAISKQPCVYVIYSMLISGGFAAACLQTIAKGVLDPPRTPRSSGYDVYAHAVYVVHCLL